VLPKPCRVISARTSICGGASKYGLLLKSDESGRPWIPPNLANLVSRSNGLDPNLCSIHGATLDGMSYHLLTALGISEEAYRNEPDSAVYGTGQGSTYSPPAWAQIVSKLFDAHGKKAHGATYCSLDGSLKIFLHMLGFVDDTKHHVNDMISPHPQSVETLVSKMAQDSQLWSYLLTASGAALELSKMYFYSFWAPHTKKRTHSLREP
jgi:hypothetical protein